MQGERYSTSGFTQDKPRLNLQRYLDFASLKGQETDAKP